MTIPHSPQEWTQFIANAELPAFGSTLAHIGALNEFMTTHSADLARVILRDPLMTTKILRVVNTVHFNPSQKKISTISRAIVVLGFQAIRNLCVANLLLDELLKRSASEPLRREIAMAFDTAMQAREIALARHEPDVEKIFIAALLSHVGELSFWACGGQSAEQLGQLLSQGMTADKAEQQVLGFQLQNLTSELAKEWRINDTLIQVCNNTNTSDSARCVRFADNIARHLDCELASEQAEALLEELSEFTGKSGDEWRLLRKEAQASAAQMLKNCGAGELSAFFGAVKNEPIPPDSLSYEPGIPNLELQLGVLHEMALLSQQKPDINLVLQLALEGIHRGGGLHRVGVALLNPAHTHLSAKYFMEWPTASLQNEFHFEIPKIPIMQSVVNEDLILWAKRDGDHYGFGVILKATNASDCLIGPLCANGKTIGVFYGDKGTNPLTQADAESFELFIIQARLCLQTLQKQPRLPH